MSGDRRWIGSGEEYSTPAAAGVGEDRSAVWTPAAVAWRRIAEEWHIRFQTFRSVVDWTVALYVALPAAAFFAFQYATWWREAPVWLGALPESLLLVALGFVSASGGLRSLLRRADALFLLQRGHWLRSLRVRGAAYAAVAAALGAAFGFALAAPFAFGGGFAGPVEYAAWYALALALRLTRMALRARIQIALAGWRRRIARTASSLFAAALFAAIVALAPPAAVAAAALTVLAAAAWGVRAFVRRDDGFLALVEYEEERRVSGMDAIYRGYVEKPPSRRARPLWLRSSKPLFPGKGPEAVLADTILKAALRRRATVLAYLQLLSAGGAAVALVPVVPVRLIVAALLALLLLHWLWQQTASQLRSPFAKLHPFAYPVRAGAGAKVITALAAPGAGMFGLLAGALSWGLPGAVVGAAIGAAAAAAGAHMAPPPA